MKRKIPSDPVTYHVKVPAELVAKLKDASESEDRSIHYLIIRALRREFVHFRLGKGNHVNSGS